MLSAPLLQCHLLARVSSSFFFFFNDTATTEIYTLSLHDALPICPAVAPRRPGGGRVLGPDQAARRRHRRRPACHPDRKSTRLNSSHGYISYAVFCLKKKKNKPNSTRSNTDRIHA